MLDLLAIGEVMAEIRNGSDDVNSPDFSVGFAGDTYNTAVYCKRELGADGKVGFMTRVGQDNLSLTLIKKLSATGWKQHILPVMSGRRLVSTRSQRLSMGAEL